VDANTVKVWVGFKPSSYFMPEDVKKAFRTFKEHRKESERRFKEAQEELNRKREKGLLTPSPKPKK
jgi:hypothetical protein